MREVIIDTRPGGTVAITIPSERAVQCLMHGPVSEWSPWFEKPWWFEAVQFARKVARGVKPSVAYRFCRAMRFGGLSRREAVELIAEYSVGHLGTAIDIVDISEIPTDRTYRDAWRRSPNGGPVWIDEAIAQSIDEERSWRAYEHAQA